MTIDADVGEMASGVPDLLRAMGAVVRLSQLDASDYLVGHDIGVERKSVDDLHRSIGNRRLWVQLRSYRAALRRLLLVVEGEDLDRGPITASGVRGALLEIGDRGVTVIRTRDPTDTAAWILRLAVRAQRPGVPPRPRPRRHGRAARPADIVMGIPGIGPSKARCLLGRFGSVAAIAAADPKALETAPGIGPTLSRVVHEALNRI